MAAVRFASVLHAKFEPIDSGLWRGRPFTEVNTPPDQLRWDPLPLPGKPTDLIDSVVTVAGDGGISTWRGSAVHIYAANSSMHDRYFYNADGELLLVPEWDRSNFAPNSVSW